MSVPCPGCGRDYDVALFQFGRTVHCTCGARVGLEPRVRRLPASQEIRFIADAMVGRLARWLRLIGRDTAFEPDIEDAELVRRAIEEERIILTRDRRIREEWRAPHLVCIDSEDPLEQLREVVERYGLDWRGGLFSRCSRCNGRLAPATREEVAADVPPRVLDQQTRFVRCTRCRRVYWEGSHTARMRASLEGALCN